MKKFRREYYNKIDNKMKKKNKELREKIRIVRDIHIIKKMIKEWKTNIVFINKWKRK